MSTLVDKQFLTAKELAIRLGVSRETAHNYIRRGVVPSVGINGRRCVPVGALAKWIAEKDEEALAAVRTP
jgi:excisionase family DNA binding protein